ncbi:hypothetical protein PV05_05658 [Exophiala xenobiotica]|uniref:Fe2OG dioxygenase domain-containing protein n=1 Tax=Exophiala xenobiotica TaxID=348802 RepID=A0A0D2ENN3_9EURO|nr:uncharacterized protein PV05_05658 [Exophiala xenobiotica]KIW57053.1 hypothetical protein PV05_05658 [Exophiala xenobiotica]
MYAESTDMEDPPFVAPPPGPPPLLSDQQLLCLARQGWLCVDLPDALSNSIDEVLQCSLEFFRDATQPKAELYPSKLGTEFGYYHVEDEKEYVTFRCHVHGGTKPAANSTVSVSPAAKLEGKVAQAWREAGLFLFRILCDISRASDLDLSAWSDILDGTLSMPETEQEMTYTLMRLFRYLPTTGVADPHTDLGLLTLCVGDGEGLQALDRLESSRDTPVWVNAPFGTRKGTVLIGETMKALSSGTVNTGFHRVVGNPNGRSSVVFALRPSNRHDIDFALFGGEGVVSATDLWKSVQAGKVNINSIKELRDKQRAKFRPTPPKAANTETVTMGQG